MGDIAIKVEELGKKYKIGKKKSTNLREAFSTFFQQLNIFNNSNLKSEEFWALRDINFEIKRGQSVGIIGKNGAGKSTLLKLLSRITRPTTGRIEIVGRVSSLLEVGTGFHPELTGRENIFLNGTILGMSRFEVRTKFDEIVAFSGIEKFIDTPVKHYSSGMKVRLAFSVAAHLEPEILIVDEVLAVGDADFQKKCLGKMEDVTGQGRTVLFVSHNIGAIKNLCKNGLLLENGKMILYDRVDKVIDCYSNLFTEIPENLEEFARENTSWGTSLKIISFQTHDNQNKLSSYFNSGDTLRVLIKIKSYISLMGVSIVLGLDSKDGIQVFTIGSEEKDIYFSFDSGEVKTVNIKIGELRLNPGAYSFRVGARIGSNPLDLIRQVKFISISEIDSELPVSLASDMKGIVKVKDEWN